MITTSTSYRPAHSRPAASVLRALADGTRQKLLQLLMREELSVSELVAVLRQPQPTISRHLKVLQGAGLVAGRRDRTAVFYRVANHGADAEALDALVLEWLRGRPLAKPLEDRLQTALKRRGDKSLAVFERLANKWDELRRDAFGEAFALESFLALLPRSWTVADVGAGTGYLLPALAARFRSVIAIEPAAAMLECARQRMAACAARNVAFHLAGFDCLPLADADCDLAIACLVLHHVTKPEGALAELHRVLRPGGRVLIVEQNRHENQEFHETMQDLWRGFEISRFREQVAEAGFEGVDAYTLTSAKTRSGTIEAPELFVLAAVRPEE